MSERPEYEILGKIDLNIEIRKYQKLIWINTASFGKISHVDSSRYELFNKLFGYINGQNDKKAKFNMTSPVTMCFFPSNTSITQESFCNYTMRFYLPQEIHVNPPRPIREKMGITLENDQIVAVCRFNGKGSMDDFLKQRENLIKSLGNEASKFDTKNFIIAQYDSPNVKPNSRTNEVWFTKIR